ncbi:hypothetical protein [Ponticaulis sp.]|uniref:hypothetical protein n=1 Tax=Ponticaulis sp. TaxID=2020902 RepID=UPI00262EE8F8|nr:hypothetical protein [Ponticaulis sp.]MDF1680575.1 hypothetical protein [Ponticaulis sp.]
MEKFSFSSALMHFQNTKGPGSFVWKWLIAAFISMSILAGVFTFFILEVTSQIGPIPIGTTVPLSDRQAADVAGTMFGFFVIIIPLSMVLWSLLEASALRRYVRQEGFSIRFGKDELRVLGVYLCWFGMFLLTMIVYFVSMMIIGIMVVIVASGLPMAATYLAFGLNLALAAGLYYLVVRFSAASAVTIRDNKVTFFSAEQVTHGRIWSMIGAFLVVLVANYVIQFAMQFTVGFLFPSTGVIDTSNGLPPTVIVGIVIYAFVYALSVAISLLVNLGITSRAAITDESWSGRGGEVVETFE